MDETREKPSNYVDAKVYHDPYNDGTQRNDVLAFENRELRYSSVTGQEREKYENNLNLKVVGVVWEGPGGDLETNPLERSQ